MSELKKEWYVVNTYAGQENRVKENLERRVKTMGLEDSLFQIVVAEEKEIEYKNGKPVEKTHNLFSGYLLVQMIMTDEAWYIVRNTPGVTGFIGSSGKGAKPFPVAQEEVDAVLRRLGRQDVNVQVDFEVGDRVEITNGAFKNSEGTIESMDEEKKEAENLAKEIITKLNEGKSFDEVKDEYKDKITYEELGYKAYNASLESAYMEAMQKLENNSYTKEPVQTSYGYHVIYRIDQKEKPALKDVKEEIITSLVSEHKSKDTSVQYKALDKMREDAKLKFTDTVLEKKYETYKSQYNK